MKLQKEVKHSMRAAFAEGTTKNLEAQWKAYLLFCEFYRLKALPTSSDILCLYAQSGFALGFIFLSPPFSPIRFFLCHFLELRARFWPFFAQKEPGLGAFFAKNVVCL